MGYFRVVTEELTTAAGAVDRSGLDVAAAGRMAAGSAGALAGTPAQAAYETFCSDAQRALSSAPEVVGGLSHALSEAAFAYLVADTSAAASLAVRRGG